MSRALLRHSDRLIGTTVLGTVLLVWSILLGFDAITALIANLDDVGKVDYTAGTAFSRTLYTLPRRLYELFPSAAMIGCVLGLGSLAATSELTALRAAGLSKLRICGGAILVVAVLTVVMVINGETAGPWGEVRAQALTAKARSRDVAMSTWSGLWAREGDTFINARHGRVEGEGAQTKVVLSGVTLYEFDKRGHLDAIALVGRAEHLGGRWTLFDISRSVFEPRQVRSEKLDSQIWDSQLKPELLSLSLQRPRYLSTKTLSEGLEYLERNNLDPGPFAAAYWARWFYPLNALVLCLAAMPFAFGALRSGGFGKRLFLGLVFGLAFFLIQRLAVDLAQVYRIDLRIAHLLPPALVATAAALYFRRAA